MHRPLERSIHGLVTCLALAAAGLLTVLPGGESCARGDTRSGQENLHSRVMRLIDQLGAEEYAHRERAQAELARLGLEAFDALYRAQYHEDIEIAMRARYLVRSIPIRWIQERDPIEVQRTLRNYDQYGATERVSRMQRLAFLEQWQGTEALCRLVRFETSGVLSKRAALLVLQQPVPEDLEQRKSLAHRIERAVGASQRPAIDWLRTYAQYLIDPEATVESWNRLTQAEQEVFVRSPDITTYEIVRDLLRWYVALLSDLGHDHEALVALKQAIQLRNGSPEDLVELTDWLLARSAWEVIDEVAQKYADRFDRDATLLYRLAEAQRKQGDKQRSERTALRALATQAKDRAVVARGLSERGLLDWSEREYRQMIKNEPDGSRLDFEARYFLAELLHDQERDLSAAETLRPGVDLIQSTPAVAKMVDQWRATGAAGVVARMHFFYALHHRRQGNRTKQVEHLTQAVESSPTDADVLIAMFRLPDPDEAWRTTTREKIKAAAQVFRQGITKIRRRMETENRSEFHSGYRVLLASSCNQFAWLISNTEGDFREALRCSHESLKMIPNEAGFLDTLGRCYYALGDYENAVKYQTRAVELEPYSGQIKRQLKQFQNALEQSKTQSADGEQTQDAIHP